MKFIINRASFQDALMLANSVVPRRSPKPSLACVLVETGGATVSVSATDLERRIRSTVNQVQIERAGSVLASADKLTAIVRSSSDDTLTVELEGDQLHVRSADAHYKLNTEPAGQFPPDRTIDGVMDSVSIPASVLAKLISRTVGCAAAENTRYAFNAVLMECGLEELKCVATDGRRLALATDRTFASDKPIRALVPVCAANTLMAMDLDPESGVTLCSDGNVAIFTTDDARLRLSTVLIEGQFPSYDEVIPKDPKWTATMGRVDMESALRRARLMVTEESNGVRMTFDRDLGVVMSSRSPSDGEATVTLPCRYDDGGNGGIEIVFNPIFILDAIKTMDADDVVLEMTSPIRPALLKSGVDHLVVIMPVKP